VEALASVGAGLQRLSSGGLGAARVALGDGFTGKPPEHCDAVEVRSV